MLFMLFWSSPYLSFSQLSDYALLQADGGVVLSEINAKIFSRNILISRSCYRNFDKNLTNMKTIISLFASGIIILFAAINTTKACVPASSATVFSTINITANGYTQVTNMPTGTVIQLNITLPYTQVYFNFCATNVGMVPSGTNDGFATILDANGPSANEITTGDDGCSNVSAPGYGPPNFEYTFVTTGTYFLYLTEYDPSGSDECFGSNGSNSSFIADIDYVVPGVFDVNPLPGANEYTRIPLPIATIPVSGSVFNYGSTMGTFNLYGDVFQLPNTTTPVQSYSLLNNTVNAFETLAHTRPPQ
jgi:hypothetical protein